MHRNIKRLSLGIPASIGIAAILGLASSNPVYADEPTVDDSSRIPYINLEKKTTTGDGSLLPKNGEKTETTIRSTFDLTVNNAKSYKVYISTENNKLVGSKAGNDATIDPLTSGTLASLDQIPANHWGYRASIGDSEDSALGSASFKSVPEVSASDLTADKLKDGNTTADLIGELIAGANGNTDPFLANIKKVVTLDIGASVNSNLPADTYSGAIVLSAVAEPRELTLFDITTMQQMTTDICNATLTPTNTATRSTIVDNNGNQRYDLASRVLRHAEMLKAENREGNKTTIVPEFILKDNRDGNDYLVRKLADGNCWMSENLRLNFLGTKPGGSPQDYAYEPTVNGEWTGEETLPGLRLTVKNTDINADLATVIGSDGAWTPEAAKRGDYATAGIPAGTKTYATIFSTRSTATYLNYRWAENGYDGLRSFSFAATQLYCVADGAINSNVCPVVGTGWNETPGGEAGNLYNWTAVTLGTSLSYDTGEMLDKATTSSICPRGWMLPSTSSDGDSEQEKYNNAHSFRHLFRDSYDIVVGETLTDTDSNGVSQTISSKLWAFPLGFYAVGYYRPTSGRNDTRFSAASWWTNASGGRSDLADTVFIRYDRVAVDNEDNRGFGYSVRCVAR